jgi:hypothetical protein
MFQKRPLRNLRIQLSMAVALLISSQFTWAGVVVYTDLASWQNAVSTNGLFDYLEDFNSLPDGGLPILNMGGAILTPGFESGAVSGGQVVTVTSWNGAPHFGFGGGDVGTISGLPIFALAIDQLNVAFGRGIFANVGSGLQFFDSGLNFNGFVGIVSDTAITSFQMGGSSINDNFRLATSQSVPAPDALFLFALGLMLIRFQSKRSQQASNP